MWSVMRGPSEVVLEMVISETQLKMVITDNGQGFNPRDSASGNGLLNLRDRLASMGGRSEIISGLGTGTVVCFEIPLLVNFPS